MKKVLIILSLMVIFGIYSVDAKSYKGDFNDDGKVDMTDYAIMTNGVAKGNPGVSFDLNRSGKVDADDFNLLANLIVNEQLIEDDSINIGIGGWDDPGEDWGGAVYAPAKPSIKRQNYDLSMYFSRLKYDYDTKETKWEIHLNGADAPVALLVNIEMPSDVLVQKDYIAACSESGCKDLSIMGVPRLERIRDREYLRFIVASPSLNPIKETSDHIVTFTLKGKDTYCNAYIRDCNAVMIGSNEQVAVRGYEEYDRYWMYVPVSKIYFEREIINCNPGDYIEEYPIILPENATNKDVEIICPDTPIVSQDEWYQFGISVHERGKVQITARTLDGSNLTGSYIIDSTLSSVALTPSEYESVIVYDLYGRQISIGRDSTSLAGLPSGIYLVTMNGVSTKYVVK